VPLYVQTRLLPWLTPFMARGYLTSEEVERLQSFAEMFGCRLDAVETEIVFYAALAGEYDQAIQGFAWLLRSCGCLARRMDDGTIAGWGRARIITEASKTMQNNVMTYLPEILGEEWDTVVLESAVNVYGYRRSKVG